MQALAPGEFTSLGGSRVVRCGIVFSVREHRGWRSGEVYTDCLKGLPIPEQEQQEFHRLFLVPGRGHCGGTGTVGTSNPPLVNFQDMFNVLVNWVEKGEPTVSVVATTADKAASRPICVYPSQVKYQGGDVN